MEMRREGKVLAFQDGTFSFWTINIHYSEKMNLDFLNKIHAN